VHSNEMSHKCSVCEKSFKRLASLKAHMCLHTAVKPHRCTTCGTNFVQRDNLIDHMAIHRGEKPHRCTTCGKIFQKRCTLNEHMAIHTGIKPHRCTTCAKSFRKRSTLNGHMAIHTGVKPYRCTTCGKSFGRHYELKSHVVVHSLTAHMCLHTDGKCDMGSVGEWHFNGNGVRSSDLCEVHSCEKPSCCLEYEGSFGEHVAQNIHVHKHDNKQKSHVGIDNQEFTTGSPDNKRTMYCEAGDNSTETECEIMPSVVGSASQLSGSNGLCLGTEFDTFKTFQLSSDIKLENVAIANVQQLFSCNIWTETSESYADKTTNASTSFSKDAAHAVDTFSADICPSHVSLDIASHAVSIADVCSPFAALPSDSLPESCTYPHCSSSTVHQLINPKQMVDYFPQPVVIEPSHMDSASNQPVHCTQCKSLHASNQALALHMKLDHSCQGDMLLLQKTPQNITAGVSCSPANLTGGRHCSFQFAHIQSTAEQLLSSIQSSALG